MFAGVALALSELPMELIERHRLGRRICDRGGEREVQFLFADAERVLPVWIKGQLNIVRGGNRRGQSLHLPGTALTQLSTVENGGWSNRHIVPVIIPATMGLDKGVWYRIRQGIRGLVVQDSAAVRACM